ncbi:MAG: IS66 family transposase, partial [Flammeovirgaceae bacterium]
VEMLKVPPEPEVERKIFNRLKKQQDHLFTFLIHPQVDATNNLAERSLRPAVIHRKIACGNRTRKGADTWQVIASIVATTAQNEEDFNKKVEVAIKRRLQP